MYNFADTEAYAMNSANDTSTNISGKPSGIQLLLAHLGIIFTVSAWGTSFVATKVLMVDGGFTPIEVYTYRFTFAYLLLLLFTFRKIRANNWADEVTFILSGICCGSLYFITENYALANTTTSNVSLLASISPIFTTILMAVVYKMHIQGGVIIGSVIAFVGVGCVIFSSGDSIEIHPFGDILALSAAMSWAVYTLLIKRLIPIYNSFFITRKLFFYGVLSSIPLLLAQREPYHLMELFDVSQPQFLLNFLFLACICSVAAYLIWNESMKKLGSVMANNYLYGQPIVTMIIAALYLHERVTLIGYIGCALIIGGLVLSDKIKLKLR